MRFRTGRRNDDSKYKYPIDSKRPGSRIDLQVHLTPSYLKWMREKHLEMENKIRKIPEFDSLVNEELLQNPNMSRESVERVIVDRLIKEREDEFW